MLNTADSECVDAMADVLVASSSDDHELPLVDMLPDAPLAQSDHLYCRPEATADDSDEQTSPTDQTVQAVLKDSVTDIRSPIQRSSVYCVKSETQQLDNELSTLFYPASCSYSSSDDTSNHTKFDLSHCSSAAAVQSLDSVVSVELDVADTEDVSLGSSETSGLFVSGCSTVLQDDEASCGVTQLADGAKGLVTASEVVDQSGGRSVELECQCGAQCSDPAVKLHVVECQRCHSYQHATCVNYDLTDPFRGNYLCPHCHVIEVRHFYTYVFLS